MCYTFWFVDIHRKGQSAKIHYIEHENTPSVRVTVDVNVREARQVIFPHFCNVVWRPVLTIFEIHNG